MFESDLAFFFDSLDFVRIDHDAPVFSEVETSLISSMTPSMMSSLSRSDLFTPNLGSKHLMEGKVEKGCIEGFDQKQSLEFLFTVDKKELRRVIRCDGIDLIDIFSQPKDYLKLCRIVRSCFPTRDLASKKIISTMHTWERYKFPLIEKKKILVFSPFPDNFYGHIWYDLVKIISYNSVPGLVMEGKLQDWSKYVNEVDLVMVVGSSSDGMGLSVNSTVYNIVCQMIESGLGVIFQTVLSRIPPHVVDYNKIYPHDEEIVVYCKKKQSIEKSVDLSSILENQKEFNYNRTLDVLYNTLDEWRWDGFYWPPNFSFSSVLKTKCRPICRDNYIHSSGGDVVPMYFRKRCLDPKEFQEYPAYIKFTLELPIVFQDFSVPPGDADFVFYSVSKSVLDFGGTLFFDEDIGWCGM